MPFWGALACLGALAELLLAFTSLLNAEASMTWLSSYIKGLPWTKWMKNMWEFYLALSEDTSDVQPWIMQLTKGIYKQVQISLSQASIAHLMAVHAFIIWQQNDQIVS